MKIQAVSIDGFKNLSDVKIKLNSITALVALNNYGKSNVLTAIDFSLAYIKSTIEDKSRMMANPDLIPLNKVLYGKNFCFEMELLAEFNNKEYQVIYGYEFSWKYNKRTTPHILSEYLRIRPKDHGQKYNQLISRDDQKATYRSSETGRCSTHINVDPTELVLNKLRAFDGLFYANLIKKLNSLTFYFEESFDMGGFYAPDVFIRKDLEENPFVEDNLPRVIYRLQEDDPDSFSLLKGIFIDLFPDVEDIVAKRVEFELSSEDEGKLPEDLPFTVGNAIYALFVKNKNLKGHINFSMMSNGAKRVFMILTRIILAKASNVSLMAIEEPENSVDPGLFRAYIQIIDQLLDGCKLIITSHSPYIVSYLNPAWIHIGINNPSGIANFYPLKKSGQKLLQQGSAALDMNMGDYLFSMLSDPNTDWLEYLECKHNG